MPGIETVCHKLRPEHYSCYYDYYCTDSPLQGDQTKRKKRKDPKHSEVNPMSV